MMEQSHFSVTVKQKLLLDDRFLWHSSKPAHGIESITATRCFEEVNIVPHRRASFTAFLILHHHLPSAIHLT